MQIKIIMIATATLFFVACGHNSHQHSTADAETKMAHAHGAGEKYTVYSDRYELFMEATEIEPGHKAELLLHLTRLADFKPISNAEVSVMLDIDGNVVGTKKAKLLRTGIYDCDLDITREGHGRLQVILEENGQSDTLVVKDIHLHEAHDDHDHEAEEAAAVNGISFTKEQQWKIDFATANPEKGYFGEVIKTTGKVEAVPTDQVLVTAKTNGFVSFTSSLAEGAELKKGQLLMTLSGNELAENNSAVRYETAKSEYELANANYERLKLLTANKIVAEKELLEAKSWYNTAKIAFEILEKQFNIEGQKIVSPRTGFIKQLLVKNGQYVVAGDPLCLVFNNQQLQIVADVVPKYLTELQNLASVNLEIPGKNEVLSLDSLNGKVVAIGKATNQNNYLVPVTLQMDQTDEIIPGSFVPVYFRTVDTTASLTVPNSALLEEQGNFYLFVQVNPELFEKHEVKTGATDGLRTEILSGLSETDRVVTKGAVLVKLSKSAGALDAHSGHVH